MHEKVKQKIRENLGQWEREFGHDASLDIVRDTCEKLRRQGKAQRRKEKNMAFKCISFVIRYMI